MGNKTSFETWLKYNTKKWGVNINEFEKVKRIAETEDKNETKEPEIYYDYTTKGGTILFYKVYSIKD